VTINSGTATVTLSSASGVSSSNVQTLINGMTYQNTSQDPTAATRAVTLTSIQDTGGTANGGVDTTTVAIAANVTVAPTNDAPTLSSTATNPNFQEAPGLGTQATAVNVFSGTSVSTIESGQSIIALNFTVSGLQDGVNESMVVDGKTITLGANSSGTTTTNGMSYTVTISSGTATISLTKAAGVSSSNIATLVNGITYQDTNTDNPTAGARVFTLTSVQDNGGTAHGGVDTTSLAIASTVTVIPVNDAPT
jgi:hypothetical protein